MGLQITDGRGDVAVQDSRARPLRVGDAGRDHVLGPAVQRRGYRIRARIGHRSPVAGEDLVRPPAKEERGRAAVDLVEIVPGFGVEKWYGPSAAVEAAAAILVRSAQPLHHAVHRDVGRGRQPHVVSPRRTTAADPIWIRATATDKHTSFDAALAAGSRYSFGFTNRVSDELQERLARRRASRDRLSRSGPTELTGAPQGHHRPSLRRSGVESRP
jgi:hypothetical protein